MDIEEIYEYCEYNGFKPMSKQVGTYTYECSSGYDANRKDKRDFETSGSGKTLK